MAEEPKVEDQVKMVQRTNDGETDAAIARKLKMSAPQLAKAWEAVAASANTNNRSDAVDVLIARLLKDARRALADEKAALALVLATPQQQAVVVLDSLGTITSVSLQSASILGMESSELIGKPIDALLAGRFRDVAASSDEMSRAEQGELVVSTRTHARDDGSSFEAEHTIIALVGRSGSTSGFARVICDITQRRLHEVRIEELDASVALLVSR